jgi:copper resistance protein C
MRIRSFIVIASAMLCASPALAHARLEEANPPVGGVIAASPAEIRLKFSEGVEPDFSTISLNTEQGAPIALGKPHLAPGNPAMLQARVEKPLAAGTYVVSWHAVSVDTHRTQGDFRFTVKK